jgi:hypothetical protein
MGDETRVDMMMKAAAEADAQRRAKASPAPAQQPAQVQPARRPARAVAKDVVAKMIERWSMSLGAATKAAIAVSFAEAIEADRAAQPSDTAGAAERDEAGRLGDRWAYMYDVFDLVGVSHWERSDGTSIPDVELKYSSHARLIRRAAAHPPGLVPVAEVARWLEEVQAGLRKIEWRAGQSFGLVVCPVCSRCRAPDVEPVHIAPCWLADLIAKVGGWLAALDSTTKETTDGR